MKRAYYSETIAAFVAADSDAIQGQLNVNSEGPVEPMQIRGEELETPTQGYLIIEV